MNKVRAAFGAMIVVARALDQYAEEHHTYPRIAELAVKGTVLRRTKPMTLSVPKSWVLPPAWPIGHDQIVSRISSILPKQYGKPVPEEDPWGNPLLCGFTEDFLSYTLISTGADRKIDEDHAARWSISIGNLARDIIWSNNVMISGPDEFGPDVL